ncbi:MAG: hypothetical protein CMG25_03750 [Candidatus Marinimicrobia bacterium]|nr:hypothetical protein [Candidatus Neomarinimicrobiota bacterium]|tara:strand:- start:4686 stop:5087 length:402 start_codon:yes stop_codon:yes gene_type:complete
MIKIDNKQYEIQLYTTSLMLMVASADNNISNNEIEIIKKIITDFFKINEEISKEIISKSYNIIDEATDIYQIASFINKSFDKEEKIRLIYSTFKIAYSDKKFHYMERHLINQIANILNLHKKEIIEIKKGILI